METPGFVVLYRWRLKPGREQDFVEGWSAATRALLARGSRGSRLHRGSDGIWYAYAQWPSAEARRQAFESPSDDSQADDSQAYAQMEDAVAERLPEVVLAIESDHLVG